MYVILATIADELKESRITNRPGEDDLVFLKTNEIHLNNEIIRLKSEIKILSEISKLPHLLQQVVYIPKNHTQIPD